jgi:hypothetical protein
MLENIFLYGATAPSEPRPPLYRGFAITLRHTKLSSMPLDWWSVERRDIYLTTHSTQRRQTSMIRREGYPQSQQGSGRRQAPCTTRRLGLAENKLILLNLIL